MIMKRIKIFAAASIAMFMLLPIIFISILLMLASGEEQQTQITVKRMLSQSYIAMEPTELARKEIPPEMLDVLLEVQNYYNIPWTILAAYAKHKTDFGRKIPRNHAGAYAVTAEWWSGKGATTFVLDPNTNVANGGWGINEHDYADNQAEIDAAISHNASCSASNTSDEDSEDSDSSSSSSSSSSSDCTVPVPSPIYTADPNDFRDATMALARYLEREGFQTNPRGTLVKLVGRRSLANMIISKADKYGTVVERSTVPRYYFANNQIPREYIPIYQRAASAYGIPWTLLAAHHRVETVFSTIRPMISSAGAEGHMQFMPCTWIGWSHPSCSGNGVGNFTDEEKTDIELIATYGGYGTDANGDEKASMWDIEDAVFSAAKFLAANGAAEGDFERAIYAYNHSQEYVENVLYFKSIYDSGYVAVDGAGYVGEGNDYIIWPVDLPYTITSHFGHRTDPISGAPSSFHEGTDIVGPSQIRAIANGRVVFAGEGISGSGYGGLGNVVAIDHGNHVYSLYAHMADGSLKVRTGEIVHQGTILGTMGSTGRSTGVHLHFEIRLNSPKRDSATIPINPVCVYKATSSPISGNASNWTDFISQMDIRMLQYCN